MKKQHRDGDDDAAENLANVKLMTHEDRSSPPDRRKATPRSKPRASVDPGGDLAVPSLKRLI